MFNKKISIYVLILMFSFFNKTMSNNSKTFFDFKINSINGEELDLSIFERTKLYLVSKCC